MKENTVNSHTNTVSVRISKDNFKYAEVWRRFLSFLIDIVLLSTLLFVFFGFEIESIIWAFLLSFLYFIAFWIIKGATLGNMLFRIKLIGQEYETVGIKKAIIRYFSFFLAVLPLFAGIFMILFNNKRQCLHDKLSKTYVIRL